MEPAKQKYDVIIIGSGPGGASTAKELTEQGRKVCILERGPDPKLKNSFFQYILYQLIPFKSLLFTNGFLGMVRGIITGGSSVFYYATCCPVPLDMLKKYGIDLSEEVENAKSELPSKPLDDNMITPMADKIMKSAQKLGYNWQKLDKFMYQEKWSKNQKFGYYGDPDEIKWTSRMYVNQAVKNGARLITNAKVEKIVTANQKAKGVIYKKGLRKYRIDAPVVVLSAGGIGTPVILRKSGIKKAGYNFFFDPLITVCGTVDEIKAENEIPMSAGIHLKKEGYMMTDMSVPLPLDMLFSAQVLRFNRLFSQKKTLRIMIKIKDDLGGRITRLGQVRKKLTKNDREKFKSGYKKAEKILKQAGAKGIHKTWYTAAHPGGTAKIGEIVDSNLMTEYKNLYVCDCSVIPEPWGLPPTLTLVSLGKRLAKHLVKNT